MTIRIEARYMFELWCIKLGREPYLLYDSQEELRRFFNYCNTQNNFKELFLLYHYPITSSNAATMQEAIDQNLHQYNIEYIIPIVQFREFRQAVRGFNRQQEVAPM